jgi:uncharacterized protein (DUF1499 family)
MRIFLFGGTIVAIVGVVFVAGLVVLNRTQGGHSAGSPDLAEGTLAPCPDSPNCVSTRAPRDDERHHVAPISFADDAAPRTPEDVLRLVEEVVERQPRMEIVERGPAYIRATATSRVFRFVDDIDFLIDPDAAVIHMRSASRVGEGDMGVNRRRYELFREVLENELSE